MGKVSAALKRSFLGFFLKKDKTLETLHQNNPPLSMFSMSQASRGTVKASGNFNASADAEVLYKAMKGLGKMLVCMLSAQCHLIHQRCVTQSVVQLQQTNESVLGGDPL